MAKRFWAAEEGHIVNALAPVDVNGGKNSDVWSMANYNHATIIISLGVTASGSEIPITVEECDDFTPSNSTAIGFAYYSETTAGGDTLGARQTATASGFTTSADEPDNTFYVIEVDAAELSDGYPNLRVVCADPGASVIGAITVVLSGARYVGEASATAIA